MPSFQILILSLLGAIFPNLLWAAVGEILPEDELPRSVCRLDIYDDLNNQLPFCSATVVSLEKVSTAAHCVSDKAARYELLCPGGFRSEVKLVDIHPKFDPTSLSTVIRDNSENDHAIFLLNKEFIYAPHKSLTGLDNLMELIYESKECAVFGYGGYRPSDERYAQLKGVKVSPEALRVAESGSLEARLKKAGYSGLISAGDSGGSLSCKNHFGEWVHIGVSSNAPLAPYQSNFAPYYGDNPHIDLPAPEVSVDTYCKYGNELKDLGLIRLKALAENGKAELEPIQNQELRDKYAGFTNNVAGIEKRWKSWSAEGRSCERFYARGQIYSREIERLQIRLERMIIDKIQKEPKGPYYVKPFSRVEIDRFNPESFVLRRFKQSEMNRFAEQENPYSLVDIPTEAIQSFKLMGNQKVMGDIYLEGPSEHFLCEVNILCARGLYKNVMIPIERLTRIKPRFK